MGDVVGHQGAAVYYYQAKQHVEMLWLEQEECRGSQCVDNEHVVVHARVELVFEFCPKVVDHARNRENQRERQGHDALKAKHGEGEGKAVGRGKRVEGLELYYAPEVGQGRLVVLLVNEIYHCKPIRSEESQYRRHESPER